MVALGMFRAEEGIPSPNSLIISICPQMLVADCPQLDCDSRVTKHVTRDRGGFIDRSRVPVGIQDIFTGNDARKDVIKVGC